MIPDNSQKRTGEGGSLTTVYRLEDEAGNHVADHVRQDYLNGDKECRWRLPDGRWTLDGTKLAALPLYGCQDVAGWDEDELIVVCEGEPARDALTAAGLNAVGSVTGAGATPGEKALEVLRDRRVCLWPDTDEAGRRHMDRIAERLHPIAAEVTVYEWHDAPEVWIEDAEGKPKLKAQDAADHPAIKSKDGKAIDRLLTDLEGAPRWEPTPPARGQSRPTLDPGFNLTDLGNAERLIYHHGHDLMFCYKWNKWLVWDGKRWAVDDGGAVELRAKMVVRNIYAEAAAEADDARRRALADHAKRSEAQGRIAAMISLARSEPGVPVQPDELDADPWLLNTPTGTFDFKTGRFRPHDCFDRITKLTGTEYDEAATAPTWKAFLEKVLPSPALRRFVKKLFGYCLTGDVSEQVLPFLCGPGANGKSTAVNALLAMLGDYAQQAAPDLLLAKHGSHPTELADLYRARLVASVEVEDGRRLAESLVKQLTGGDRIKARRMREDFWEFDPTHKALLVANHRPEVRGTDHAIWRRIKLIPFEVTIPKSEQDPRLPEKLRDDLPGILRWAVEGCLEWQREGLGEPDEVRAATEGYRTEMDVLGAFIESECVVHERASAGATPLYHAYREWCERSGEKSETQTKFGRRLRERGFTSKPTPRIVWYGIGLRDDREPTPDPDGGIKQFKESLNGSGTENTNCLNGENPIDTGNEGGETKGLNSLKPISNIDGSFIAHEGLIPKKGLEPFNPLNNPTEDEPPPGEVDFDDDFPDDPGETEPATVAASREPEGPDEKTLGRVRWAFRQRGRGPQKNLSHYRSGDCSLEILVGSVLFELREDHHRMTPEELKRWADATRHVAEEGEAM